MYTKDTEGEQTEWSTGDGYNSTNGCGRVLEIYVGTSLKGMGQ